MIEVDMTAILDRIDEITMENARLSEENENLKALMLDAWQWVGNKPPGGVSGLTRKYRDMLKSYTTVIRNYRKDLEERDGA
tara:strand:+ start:3743 stop:3985 length:243 start_codon:yes stop_codon:yes gene_type:complete